MLLRVLLVQLIFTITIGFLFSHKAISAPKKDVDNKLDSTKINNKLSNNTFSSLKSDYQREPCIFIQELIAHVDFAVASKQFSKIDTLLAKALKHSSNCKGDHVFSALITTMKAAYVRKNEKVIKKLSGQLVRGPFIVPDSPWPSSSTCALALSMMDSVDNDANDVRDMIASEIINEKTNFSSWTSRQLCGTISALSRDKRPKIKNALKKIINHVFTNITTIDQWSGLYLKDMISGLCAIGCGNLKTMGFLKIANLVTDLNLSICKSISISSLFCGLSEMILVNDTKSDDYLKYKKALEIIIKHITAKENLSDWSSYQISIVIVHLARIKPVIEVDNIIDKFAGFIASKKIDLSSWTFTDISLTAQALGDSGMSEIRKDAIRNIAFYLGKDNTDMSGWRAIQLMQVALALSRVEGYQVENTLQKIANLVASEKTNLDDWIPFEIAQMAEALSRDKHNSKYEEAIQKIAKYACDKNLNWTDDDQVALACTLGKSGGDDCIKFVHDFACYVNAKSFSPSVYLKTHLSMSINAFSRGKEVDVMNALKKLTLYFIKSNRKGEGLSSWSTVDLTRVISAFGSNYKQPHSSEAIKIIANYIADFNTRLSQWPIKHLQICLKMLRSDTHFILTQKALKKIIVELNRENTDLESFSVQGLSMTANGSSRVMDYSSEAFIVELANIYIKKISCDESECRYGLEMLKSICRLPLISHETIRVGVNIATKLRAIYYSQMNEVDKIMFYWYITLLNFSVFEGWPETDYPDKEVKNDVCELVKNIPVVDGISINKNKNIIAPWQLEFMNIVHYRYHNSTSSYTYGNDVLRMPSSKIEDELYRNIKSEFNNVKISREHPIALFPVDIFMKSGEVEVCVEVDGPYHSYIDNDGNMHMSLKDRFIDYVLEKKLGYKIMRINYLQAESFSGKRLFINKIKDLFVYNRP